eukprot:7571210-Pyramimonas_sp.AAC.1
MAASRAGRRRENQLRELVLKPPFAIPPFRPTRVLRAFAQALHHGAPPAVSVRGLSALRAATL